MKFALVGENVRVRARRRNEIIVADKLADPRPWHPAKVKQRDAAVTQIVRREVRDVDGQC